MCRIAIVAALEREVRPLIEGWTISSKEHAGREFRFFEQGNVIVVCGGIGAEAARRAAEAVASLYLPAIIYSVGFAGALDSSLKVGDILRPTRVINAGDGSSVPLPEGAGLLVSFGSVATPEQKAKLRESFDAVAVDMEAAAVARAAEARRIPFGAVKAISDPSDFQLPPIERFVRADGTFSEFAFGLFAALRPWIWPQVLKLARNSNRASRALCDALRDLANQPTSKPQNSLAI